MEIGKVEIILFVINKDTKTTFWGKQVIIVSSEVFEM